MSSLPHRGLTYLGMDVHKDSISIGILYPQDETPEVEKIFLLPATFDEDGGDWIYEDVYALTTYDINDLGLGSVGSLSVA